MYQSILVPIEMSDAQASQATIEWCKSIGGENARITLLHVFEEIPSWAATNLPDDVMNESIQSSRKELDHIAAALGGNVHAQVRVGHAYKTILDTAEEIGADLIIVASHQPGLQDYFLGSTAAKVVRHARCSVLVMR